MTIVVTLSSVRLSGDLGSAITASSGYSASMNHLLGMARDSDSIATVTVFLDQVITRSRSVDGTIELPVSGVRNVLSVQPEPDCRMVEKPVSVTGADRSSVRGSFGRNTGRTYHRSDAKRTMLAAQPESLPEQLAGSGSIRTIDPALPGVSSRSTLRRARRRARARARREAAGRRCQRRLRRRTEYSLLRGR